jgi:hypothetical protein
VNFQLPTGNRRRFPLPSTSFLGSCWRSGEPLLFRKRGRNGDDEEGGTGGGSVGGILGVEPTRGCQNSLRITGF